MHLDNGTVMCGGTKIDKTDFASCLALPSFLNLTNGTGCCADGRQGVCGGCGQSFHCPEKVVPGFSWGIILALVADVIISVGLALQKHAHTLVDRRVTEMSRKIVEEGSNEEVKRPAYTQVRTWWIGIVLTVGAEVGNLCVRGIIRDPSRVAAAAATATAHNRLCVLQGPRSRRLKVRPHPAHARSAAYGDPNTPSSVVASLGCVAVISNTIISAFCLGEGFRRRDIAGVLMVVVGVTFIILFVPKNAEGCATAAKLRSLLAQADARPARFANAAWLLCVMYAPPLRADAVRAGSV